MKRIILLSLALYSSLTEAKDLTTAVVGGVVGGAVAGSLVRGSASGGAVQGYGQVYVPGFSLMCPFKSGSGYVDDARPSGCSYGAQVLTPTAYLAKIAGPKACIVGVTWMPTYAVVHYVPSCGVAK